MWWPGRCVGRHRRHRILAELAQPVTAPSAAAAAAALSSTTRSNSPSPTPGPAPRSVDIPELHAQQPLPSDRYNQVAQRPAGFGLAGPAAGAGFGLAGPSSTPAGGGTPGRGLFGASTGRGLGGEGLTPYGGSVRAPLMPVGPGTPSREAAEDEPALVLSQEAPQLGPPPPQQQELQAQQQQQQQAAHHFTQARGRAQSAGLAEGSGSFAPAGGALHGELGSMVQECGMLRGCALLTSLPPPSPPHPPPLSYLPAEPDPVCPIPR